MPLSPVSPQLSPDWLAHRYDPGHDAFHFVRVPRDTRRTVPFLTDENLTGTDAPLVVRRADALPNEPDRGGGARLNFVFHSAYCCSTLVANAYDRPGRSFSLKEPVMLNDLIGWGHRGATRGQILPVLGDGLRLFARPFANGERGVVKPSNVVNPLAPAILAAGADTAALLLHAPLDQYLASIAAKGLWGRLWVRDLLGKLLADRIVDLGFAPRDYFGLTDLQVAAVGWLAQHALFAGLAGAHPDRVRTLDSDTLLARPLDALTAIDRLFGVTSNQAERRAVVATVFARNAKTGAAFGAADRTADQRSASGAHADELDKVYAWAKAVAANAGVSMTLPQPLM